MVPGSIPGGVTGFFSDIFLPTYHGPGVDSAPSENEYQEHFLGVKGAGAWGWQPHHLHVSIIVEIWWPKPPGTLWTTPGLLRDCFTVDFFTKFYSDNHIKEERLTCVCWFYFNADLLYICLATLYQYWATEDSGLWDVTLLSRGSGSGRFESTMAPSSWTLHPWNDVTTMLRNVDKPSPKDTLTSQRTWIFSNTATRTSDIADLCSCRWGSYSSFCRAPGS
jgi:hypothetical protein